MPPSLPCECGGGVEISNYMPLDILFQQKGGNEERFAVRSQSTDSLKVWDLIRELELFLFPQHPTTTILNVYLAQFLSHNTACLAFNKKLARSTDRQKLCEETE
jgi:hypothetical protein